MLIADVLAGGALLALGYVAGRLVGARRIPNVIAAMSRDQIADLGEHVAALRPDDREMA